MMRSFSIVLIVVILGYVANAQNSDKVTFTLHNSSIKSIPLKIPGVMNPNLSPKSDSGVTLEIGQKVYYQKKRKNFLLFVVDESYEDRKLDVATLVKKKKSIAK